MSEQQAVLEYFLERLSRFEDVELAVCYGSFGTPAATERSDVDMYFVPGTDAARTAAFQAIVDGVGHDLWPVDWARLARIAALSDTLTALLLDGRVVRGEASAIARFEDLQAACRRSLAEPALRRSAARRLLDDAATTLGRLDGGERMAVASAVGTILVAAAFSAGAYLPSGPGRVLDRGADWLDDALRGRLTLALNGASATERLEAVRTAWHMVAARLASDATAVPLDAAGRRLALTGWYEELHSLLDKVPRTASTDPCTARLAAADAVREAGTCLHLLDTGEEPATVAAALATYRAHGLPDLTEVIDRPDLDALVAGVMSTVSGELADAGVLLRRVGRAAELPHAT